MWRRRRPDDLTPRECEVVKFRQRDYLAEACAPGRLGQGSAVRTPLRPAALPEETSQPADVAKRDDPVRRLGGDIAPRWRRRLPKDAGQQPDIAERYRAVVVDVWRPGVVGRVVGA
jgi:hypothetical protein